MSMSREEIAAVLESAKNKMTAEELAALREWQSKQMMSAIISLGWCLLAAGIIIAAGIKAFS